MYLTEYQRASVENFMGLWNRGSLDDVPVDHASDILNMAFARKRETLTRPSAGFSRNIPNGLGVVRMFDAAFANSVLIPLALDTAGNIWRLDNYTVLLGPLTAPALPGIIDFDALNMGDSVYIAPMLAPGSFDPATAIIYVWSNPAFPIRPAAGLAPDATQMAISSEPPGNVGPGWYGVAVCFVYDTGYVTPPSNVVTGYFPGGTSIVVTNVPVAPSGTVGYMVLVTQAQANQANAAVAALYEYQTVIDVLPPVTFDMNFYDTDLTILATNDPVNGNLFNTMPRIPAGGGFGSIGLMKYHNRMIVIGPSVIYDPKTATPTTVYDGRIFISTAGAPENFDELTGYLIIDSEFDGNIPRTGFELFGVLYICKAVGTYAAQDTGYQPNDPNFPWIVNIIDGGIGAYHHAVGTITGSQPSLSFNSTAFLANRNGLFLFNGNVQRPELSWKIRALWAQMTIGAEPQIRLTIDMFNDIFYILFPLTNSAGQDTLILLSGDYSLGLDSNNIRWTIYSFPWPVYDALMASWPDPVSAPNYYYLRLGSIGTIYRLDGQTSYDQIWSDGALVNTAPINAYYQLAPLILGDPESGGGVGALNICRFVRYRVAGNSFGQLYTLLADQGEYVLQAFADVQPQTFPGNYADLGIQTNFTNEKTIVKFGMVDPQGFFRMARVDVFGKTRWPTRPNA